MSPPALDKDAKLYDTKDREIVILLLAMSLEILRTVREGKRTRFFFAFARAAPFVDLWNSGKPIPISDIRLFFQAERTFNSAIHDGVRYEKD
jgi:hypothetical protein